MKTAALVFACVAAFAIAGTAAFAKASEETADICLVAARYAAEKTGVPVSILTALTLTETGRGSDNRLQPWPWTLNEGGDSHWFATRKDAIEHLSSALNAGASNVDIGCFQLNYRWHGHQFKSLEAMMEPRSNALYAARLVAGFYARSGSWEAAVGAFHSMTPEVAERYLGRFIPIHDSLSGSVDLDQKGKREPEHRNGFRLLQAGTGRKGASLVPVVASDGPLFGGP